MRQFQAHHLAYHRFVQLLSVTMGPSRALLHPFNPFTQKTLLPFIPRLGADPILLAERSKIQRPQRLHPKLYSLFHRFILFPRHIRPSSLPSLPLKSVTYVLNLLCYLCSEPGPGGGVNASRKHVPSIVYRSIKHAEEETLFTDH